MAVDQNDLGMMPRSSDWDYIDPQTQRPCTFRQCVCVTYQSAIYLGQFSFQSYWSQVSSVTNATNTKQGWQEVVLEEVWLV
jgi:hypothetical protein